MQYARAFLAPLSSYQNPVDLCGVLYLNKDRQTNI
jgi:hypothetical protein